MTTWLDRLLGRVTMYRLVLIVLLGTWVGAVVLGAVGAIPYGPLGLVESLVIALAVGYGTNLLFASLWRVNPHSESSLITAVLVVFLFLPLQTTQALGAVALAVAAANLSKYLLAWRGRHVFNPVAVGAVVVMLTRLSGAAWWVATPDLLPFIAVGGALVLYRARAWDLALPVMVIGVVGSTINLLNFGFPLGTSIWTAIGSFPYLFFGAFMVSEPLTAPPRRWQRLAVSAFIGVVALLPLHVGYVAMAPEIALVIGNAVAFGFGPRRRVRLSLVEVRERGDVVDLLFEAESALRLKPGQYVELSLPHRRQDARGARGVFSLASAPGSTAVRIVTRTDRRLSSFKRALFGMRPGQALAGSAIGGDFVIAASGSPQLWLAGGVGITPFLSAAETRARDGAAADAVLVWLLRSGDDVGLAAVLDLAGVRALVVGPSEFAAAGALPPSWVYAGERLTAELLSEHVPDAARRVVYASGSPRVVAAARAAARRVGVRRIRTDRFVGY